MKNVNFLHGGLLCSTSLREWQEYISKVGPAQLGSNSKVMSLSGHGMHVLILNEPRSADLTVHGALQSNAKAATLAS